MKNIFFFLNFLFFSCISCFPKSKNVIKHSYSDLHRESKIYFLFNDIITDSLTISDYYNSMSIKKLSELYQISYKSRCGTGCSISEVLLLKIIDNKIIPIFYETESYEEENFNYKSNKFVKSWERLEIVKLDRKNKSLIIDLSNSKSNKLTRVILHYSSKFQQYYNDSILLSNDYIYKLANNCQKNVPTLGKIYLSTKLNDVHLIKVDNRWFWVNPSDKLIGDEMY